MIGDEIRRIIALQVKTEIQFILREILQGSKQPPLKKSIKDDM